MNATTTQPAAPDAASRNILLPCPRCGEESATILLNLSVLGEQDDDHFTCRDCDGVFSAREMRAIVGKWARVLAWVDQAPAFGD